MPFVELPLEALLDLFVIPLVELFVELFVLGNSRRQGASVLGKGKPSGSSSGFGRRQGATG